MMGQPRTHFQPNFAVLVTGLIVPLVGIGVVSFAVKASPAPSWVTLGLLTVGAILVDLGRGETDGE